MYISAVDSGIPVITLPTAAVPLSKMISECVAPGVLQMQPSLLSHPAWQFCKSVKTAECP